MAVTTIPNRPQERVKLEQRGDTDFADLITFLESKDLPEHSKRSRIELHITGAFYLDDSGLLFHLGKVNETDVRQLVVPKSLQAELKSWGHDNQCGGHFGVLKTYQKLRTCYLWNGMYKAVECWVKSCTSCAQRKRNSHPFKAPLLPIPSEGLWDIVAADCLGPVTATLSGNRYIVVFWCLFTKYVEAFAVSTIDAVVISQLFMDNIIFRHGAPRRFLTDRGSNFISKLMKEVCRMVNVEKIFTSTYHPQCDGFVERINGVIAQNLSMYVSSSQTDWDIHLQACIFAYNTSISASTGYTPFFLMHGREAKSPADLALIPPQDISDVVDVHLARIYSQLRLARTQARRNIQQAQLKMKLYYDQTSRNHPIRVGHLVWVFNPAMKKGLVKKLSSLWHGPFRLTEQLYPVNFKIAALGGRELKAAVYVSRLK